MTPRMQLPEGEEHPLEFLAQLSDEDFSSLLAALFETPPSLYSSRFVRSVLKKIPHEGEERWSDALTTVLSMTSAIRHFGSTPAQTASDISSEMLRRNFLDKAQSEKLNSRLASLLSVPNVEIATQADKVLTSKGNVFSSANISTYLQPLFTGSGDSSTYSAVALIHELNMEVFDADRTMSLRAVLDDQDLQILRSEIDRAFARRRILASKINTDSQLLIQEGTPAEKDS